VGLGFIDVAPFQDLCVAMLDCRVLFLVLTG